MLTKQLVNFCHTFNQVLQYKRVVLPEAGSSGLLQEVMTWRAPVLVLIPIRIPWMNVLVMSSKLCQRIVGSPLVSELAALRIRFPSSDNFKLVEFIDDVLVVHIVTVSDTK